MGNKNESWSTIDEVAEHLKLSVDTVREYIRKNKIPHYKVGKQYRFKISEIDDWVRSGKSSDIS